MGWRVSGREITAARSLDLFVDHHLVVVGTELLDLQPFCCVAAVFLSGVAGHSLRPLISVGPAFGALESDHNPDALVLAMEGRALLERSGVTIRHHN